MTKQSKAADTRAHQDVLTRRPRAFGRWFAAAAVAMGLSSPEVLNSAAPKAERQAAFDELARTKQPIPAGANLDGLSIKADGLQLNNVSMRGTAIQRLTNSRVTGAAATNLKAGGAKLTGSEFAHSDISGDLDRILASFTSFNNNVMYDVASDGGQFENSSFTGNKRFNAHFTNAGMQATTIAGDQAIASSLSGNFSAAHVSMHAAKDLAFSGAADGAHLNFTARNAEADLNIKLTSAEKTTFGNQTTGMQALSAFGETEAEQIAVAVEKPVVADVVKAAAPHLPPRPSRVLNKAYALAAPSMAA